jgi:midasin (ATPase involved in ribosome maturation)
LLKWANRMTDQAASSTVHDLALEGFLVLGERSRNESDKRFIKETIEKVCKVKIDERKYYEDYFNKNLHAKFAEIHH